MLRVTAVEPLQDYSVSLTLTDGSVRVIDLEPCLKGEMYAPLLSNPVLFRRVEVENGTLSWPTGQDLDPDVLLGNEIATRVASRYVQAMPSICEWNGIKVYVYSDDHNPPHIHALHSGAKALVRIDNGDVIGGQLPPPQLKEVQKWLTRRRALVALSWVQAQAHQVPDKVPPP